MKCDNDKSLNDNRPVDRKPGIFYFAVGFRLLVNTRGF